MLADIIVGLQYGDEGKGKITHSLLKTQEYSHVMRFNGGCNAGHTIYHNGKKYVTHHIPAGIFYNKPSIIGAGCVLNCAQFFKELEALSVDFPNAYKNIKIASNTHIITDSHIEEESCENKIGTTKRGNGPAYRDKYNRTGIRAENVKELQDFIIDIFQEFYVSPVPVGGMFVLCEGAQAFKLDIDWGEYPYVTSSHCSAAAALLNGISPRCLGDVWGVAKVYETYVGRREFQPVMDGKLLNEVGDIGEEFGATTGRRRQCNWLDWNNIEKAVMMNGVTNLIFNKLDVLRKIDQWKIYHNNELLNLRSESKFKDWIINQIYNLNNILHFSNTKIQEVIFSERKDSI